MTNKQFCYGRNYRKVAKEDYSELMGLWDQWFIHSGRVGRTGNPTKLA